jgi:hypothetical protein
MTLSIITFSITDNFQTKLMDYLENKMTKDNVTHLQQVCPYLLVSAGANVIKLFSSSMMLSKIS